MADDDRPTEETFGQMMKPERTKFSAAQTVRLVRLLEAKTADLLSGRVDKGAFYADVADIHSICLWYVAELGGLMKSKKLTRAQLEDFLIEMDVQLVEHLGYHVKSLKKSLPRLLKAVGSHE